MLDLDWDVCPCQIDLQSPQRTSCSFSHRFRTKKLLLSSLARATRRHHGGGPGGRGPADAMRRDSQGRLRRRVHPVLQPLVSPDHDRVPRLSISCRRMVQTASLARARLAPSATAARGTAAPRAQHSSRRAGCRHPPEPEEDAAPAAESAAPTLALATVKEQLMEAEESARRGTFWLGCGGGKGRLRPGAGPPLFLVFFVLRPPAAHAAYTLRPAWGLTTVSLACLGQAVMPQPANRT